MTEDFVWRSNEISGLFRPNQESWEKGRRGGGLTQGVSSPSHHLSGKKRNHAPFVLVEGPIKEKSFFFSLLSKGLVTESPVTPIELPRLANF